MRHGRQIILAIALECVFVGSSFSQFYSPYYTTPHPNSSLDWAISPRGIALGEATVALPGYDDPFASNPAGLATVHGFWAQYATQPFFLDADDMRYRSWSVGAETPLGVFMATYRRLDYGTLPITTTESPDGIGGIESYDYTAGVAWGYATGSNFCVGVTAKMFDQKTSLVRGTLPSSIGYLIPESKAAFIFDFGIISNTGQLFGEGKFRDNLSLGINVQGFGTPFQLTYPGSSPSYPPISYPYPIEVDQPVPRNMRIGFSYQFSVASESPEQLNPIAVAVMAEYRNLLNSRLPSGGSYWGLGMEATAFEMLQLRCGGLAQPYESVYGHQNTLHVRYGVGLRAPLKRLSADLPGVTVEGDYTLFPVLWDSRSVIRLYSLGLRFEP